MNAFYSGYYTPQVQTLWTVNRPDLSMFTCGSIGLSWQKPWDFEYYSCVGALLNETGIPGPWNCPSYLLGSSAVNVTSGAWNFSVLGTYAAINGIPGLSGPYGSTWNSVPSCTVGLVLSVVSSFGSEQQSCLGCYMYGSLPASIGNLTGLTTLVLNQNLLSGSLPDSLGSLTQLVDLEMAGNQLTGSLPSSLTSLSMLVTLDLNSNSISGVLPESFGNLAALTYLCDPLCSFCASFSPDACACPQQYGGQSADGLNSSQYLPNVCAKLGVHVTRV